LTTKQTHDSITKVNPFRKHGVGIWKGNRKVVGIRIDEDLYLAFKPVAKRVFGSVCRPVEAFMASVIAMAKTGVNFGNTITIEGGLHVERNLRPRRRLVVDGPDQCTIALCKKIAVGSGVYLLRAEEYKLCVRHLAAAKDNPRQWKVI